MAKVVKLSDYRKSDTDADEFDAIQDSLVPIEFAVGFSTREKCLNKIAEYGVQALHIRRVNDEPEALLYLMGVKDAIWLNKKILEFEELSDEEIAHRIDLIQMLDNVNLAMIESLWDSFTHSGNLS